MRIAKLRSQDIANGPGIRVSVYVQGCTRHCGGCFNPETWDFSGGVYFTPEIMENLIKFGSKPFISGLSVLGGEPLQQDEELIEMTRRFKEATGKSIWMWTGYKWEDLDEEQLNMLKYVDVLMDGEFQENNMVTGNKRFRGSMNQRAIDVQKSLKKGKIILSKYD